MKRVAKLVMVDGSGKYLLMYRSNHPTFGDDPDLPGGTLEIGEVPLETMVREVFEESGIAIDPAKTKEIYAGTEYSAHGTHYTLYLARVPGTPDITMSWEHSAYEWCEREVFLAKAAGAKDTFMHMTADVMQRS